MAALPVPSSPPSPRVGSFDFLSEHLVRLITSKIDCPRAAVRFASSCKRIRAVEEDVVYSLMTVRVAEQADWLWVEDNSHRISFLNVVCVEPYDLCGDVGRRLLSDEEGALGLFIHDMNVILELWDLRKCSTCTVSISSSLWDLIRAWVDRNMCPELDTYFESAYDALEEWDNDDMFAHRTERGEFGPANNWCSGWSGLLLSCTEEVMLGDWRFKFKIHSADECDGDRAFFVLAYREATPWPCYFHEFETDMYDWPSMIRGDVDGLALKCYVDIVSSLSRRRR